MKIIQVLPELDIGGVERHVIDLSNELAERGHDVMSYPTEARCKGNSQAKSRTENSLFIKKTLLLQWAVR